MSLLNQFVESHMLTFEKYFHPITPMTNTCRMNYQSDQAIHIFFGKDISDVSGEHVKRHVYRPMSVLNSTGSHPTTDYKVYPFTKELLELTKEVEELVKLYRQKIARFNFVKTKLYLESEG